MERKQFLSNAEHDPDLEKRLNNTPEVTEEMLREQRISFAFGNAMNNHEITKESIRQASESIRLNE